MTQTAPAPALACRNHRQAEYMNRNDFYVQALRLTVAYIGLERAYTADLAAGRPSSRELIELASDARIAAQTFALKANAELARQAHIRRR